MGGIIVVDFIDMHRADNKQKLFNHIKEVMARDKTKHNILPLSKFGIMQITRQRVRPEMHVDTAETCPTCNGTGKIQPAILLEDNLKVELENLIKANGLKKITLQVHPFFAAYLEKGFKSIIKKWRREMKCKINLMGLDSCTYLEYVILDQNGEELFKRTK